MASFETPEHQDFNLSAAKLCQSRRVLVLGPSGSGKTHLSIRLGQLLGIEVIHLDAHFWKPGWIATPQEQWRRSVAALIERPGWIMDGMYENSLDLRLAAAEAVIILERRRLACLWGVLVRRLREGHGPRPDAPPGQKVDAAFVRYIWRYRSATRPIMLEHLREHGQGRRPIYLRGPKDAARLLEAVAARLNQPPSQTGADPTAQALAH